MKLQRTIAIALTAASIFTLFACAQARETPANAPLTPESTVEVVTEDPAKPDLPETDFEGASFTFASRDDSMHSYPAHTRDLFAAEMTGDIFNDAVYARNTRISDQYNIKIVLYAENEVTSETTTITAVEKSVAAGTYEYDLLCAHMIYGAASVMNDYYLNWNAIPYIDSTAPYWSQGAVEGYTVGDRLLLSLSDLCVSSNDCTHCMLFNKELASQFQIESVYDLVYNNKWTFPKFRELTKNVSSDLDGDGKMGEDDLYGYFIGGNSTQLNYLWAGGSHVCAKDENNIPYLDMLSERTINIYDFLYELRFSDDTHHYASWEKAYCYDFFSADKALFMTTQIGVINNLRNMDTDFGIIPYPKYDEAQESYGHYVDGHATLMAVPKTVESPERVGLIIEALSYDSYKTIVPIYYDTIITTKFTRDDESGDMLKIIYDSRVFDFAYVYDNWNLAFAFSNMLDAKVESFATFYAKQEKSELKQLEKTIAVYQGLS